MIFDIISDDNNNVEFCRSVINHISCIDIRTLKDQKITDKIDIKNLCQKILINVCHNSILVKSLLSEIIGEFYDLYFHDTIFTVNIIKSVCNKNNLELFEFLFDKFRLTLELLNY